MFGCISVQQLMQAIIINDLIMIMIIVCIIIINMIHIIGFIILYCLPR